MTISFTDTAAAAAAQAEEPRRREERIQLCNINTEKRCLINSWLRNVFLRRRGHASDSDSQIGQQLLTHIHAARCWFHRINIIIGRSTKKKPMELHHRTSSVRKYRRRRRPSDYIVRLDRPSDLPSDWRPSSVPPALSPRGLIKKVQDANAQIDPPTPPNTLSALPSVLPIPLK